MQKCHTIIKEIIKEITKELLLTTTTMRVRARGANEKIRFFLMGFALIVNMHKKSPSLTEKLGRGLYLQRILFMLICMRKLIYLIFNFSGVRIAHAFEAVYSRLAHSAEYAVLDTFIFLFESEKKILHIFSFRSVILRAQTLDDG